MRSILIAFLLTAVICFAKAQSIPEYERLSSYYRYYKQDSAVYFAEKGLAYARTKGDSAGVAAMLIQQGLIDDNLGDFDKAERKYKQALELYTNTNTQKGIASVTVRIGVVELRNGNYDKAIHHFLDALKISEKLDDQYGIMEATYSIAWAYLDQHNFDAALQNLQAAEAISKNLPTSGVSLNILNSLGVVYREKDDLEKAKQYFQQGVGLSNKIEFQGLNITLINNLAQVFAKEGHIEKAVAIQTEALERSRKIGNYLRELQTLLGLAKTYGKSNPDKAIFYLNEAVLLARAKGIPRQEMRYLKQVTDLYKAKGDYKQAFLMKEREHTLADSFYYKTMSQNIASLKAEYELSKSNARVKELDLVNKRNQLELQKSAIIRNVTLGGIALLLVILGLLYNQNRIKQRSNKEISEKNASLQQLLDEKEWLLREVHHRVKNNLHTVMSLLEAQSAYLEDEALLAIQNSQHRIYAMSIIHQKLYQEENVTTIDMSFYIPDLIQYLRDSFDVRQRIRFRASVDKILLDVSQAIPVGLILNEAITNAIKYAFPGNSAGEIEIKMKRDDEDRIMLSIADNGVGLPTGMNHDNTNSLGMKLMKGLSEDIHASFTVECSQGTRIIIGFKENKLFHDLHKQEGHVEGV
ncbi:MAG: tetratricopeptide repeat protein [Chitinophagaceae bacterium]